MTEYVLQSIFALGSTFLIYKVILERSGTLQFNRLYLLFTLLLGIIGPTIVLNLGIYGVAAPEINPVETLGQWLPVEEESLKGETVWVYNSNSTYSELAKIAVVIYLFTSVILLIRFCINLFRIIKAVKTGDQLSNGMQLVVSKVKTSPFSFLNYLVISEEHYQKGEISKAILNHELLHSQQHHSIDVIMLELIKCMFWFNPFVWLYSRSIIENHEFHADDYVIRQGVDSRDYAYELINSTNKNFLKLSNGFSYLSIKKRIKMMTTTKTKPVQKFTRVSLALILTTLLFFAGAFTTQHVTDPLVVVIDPGHGGKDAGATSAQLSEKEIALQISKMIVQNLEDEPIKVILTRDNDKALTLMQRIEIANYHKPDLFLSVHVNGKLQSGEGLNAFFHAGDFGEQSEDYSKMFVSNSIDQFAKAGSVLKADFFVLKNAQVPSVLIEMGGNAILNDQQVIANSIAQTISEIQKGQ